MAQQKKHKLPIGKIIAAAIVILIVVFFAYPKALFFLPVSAREKLDEAVDAAFRSYQPFKNAEGNFDFLRLLSLIIMTAGCVAASFLLRFLISLIPCKTKRGETIKSLIASLIKYIVAIYGIIFGLSILGFDIAAILASLGVLGLIIGFGAQSLIEDIITGLFIVLEGTVQVGDIITIDEYRGEVTAVEMRTISIRDNGGNTKIINNSDVRNIVNLSGVSSKAIAIAPAAYGTDLAKAEKVIEKICKKLPEINPEIFKVPAVYMGIEALNDHSIDFKISADVDEVNIFAAKRIMNREILIAFTEADIEIPVVE